jgi:hypothetical protein
VHLQSDNLRLRTANAAPDQWLTRSGADTRL